MKRTMALALTAAAVTALGAAPAQAASPKMITLTVADNGRHIRVPRGEHVMVQLKVKGRDADPSTWWRPIAENGRALQARVVGTMTPRGVTAGHYYAVHRGEATLSSARAACPASSNAPTCFAMQGWSVTVDVR
ncbi:hypothetical protein [Actinoplanes sp. NPDC051411]|uniref:hypothetical protein n=1 Tax=Actinoplanes sp. NPDC051411 TaxID=3155522 RepID=UPI00341F2D16